MSNKQDKVIKESTQKIIEANEWKCFSLKQEKVLNNSLETSSTAINMLKKSRSDYEKLAQEYKDLQSTYECLYLMWVSKPNLMRDSSDIDRRISRNDWDMSFLVPSSNLGLTIDDGTTRQKTTMLFRCESFVFDGKGISLNIKADYFNNCDKIVINDIEFIRK